MPRFANWLMGALLASALAACAGKTEHGGAVAWGEASPVQAPAAGPAKPPLVQPAPKRHLLMVVELEPAAQVARTLSSRSVDLPLPRRRAALEPAPWRAEVLSKTGAVLYSAPLEDASAVRGEFVDEHGQLRGHVAQKRVAAVTLRLPWLADASEVRVVRVAASGVTELGRVAYPQVQP
jgi:hypothetical protein